MANSMLGSVLAATKEQRRHLVIHSNCSCH